VVLSCARPDPRGARPAGVLGAGSGPAPAGAARRRASGTVRDPASGYYEPARGARWRSRGSARCTGLTKSAAPNRKIAELERRKALPPKGGLEGPLRRTGAPAPSLRKNEGCDGRMSRTRKKRGRGENGARPQTTHPEVPLKSYEAARVSHGNPNRLAEIAPGGHLADRSL